MKRILLVEDGVLLNKTQVEQELDQKDNDTYRKQHSVFSRQNKSEFFSVVSIAGNGANIHCFPVFLKSGHY